MIEVAKGCFPWPWGVISGVETPMLMLIPWVGAYWKSWVTLTT